MKGILAYLKNPITRFLIFLFSFYILWFVVYKTWIQPQETIDLFVVDLTINVSKFILETFNYTVFTGTERVIGVDGTGGLWIGDNCNGITLFSIFTGFILAYPKGKWWKKLIYILTGITLIELLNIIRVVALAILDTKSRAWTEFNHTYTFTIIIYAFIFLMWMFWVNRAEKNTTKVF
jgi:exosortase/archaeosortase family protein